ncbi:MAG: efflux RND transporter periplasmic adaptor subunit [Cyanobacteria bacterium K_DeepCast_35m_m2_023]|nr:efflux RND transporter periplasmic adaptor subunit [Cyanobacteria bacterium K_DeepCast_35m_m2_023]
MTALRPLLNAPRLLLLVPSLALVLLGGCGARSSDESHKPLTVVAVPAQDAEFETKLDGIATIEAERVVQLAPQVAGRVVSLPVRQGQRVARGQVVLVLDQAQLQAELATLRSQALADRLNHQRYESLVRQGAASVIQRDQFRQTAMASRQALAAREADLAFRNVRAPQAGVIGDVNIRPGDVVQPGVPFTQLVSNEGLRAEIELPANRAAQIRVGLPVELQSSAPGSRPFRTRISAVDPSIVAGTQLLLAQAQLPPNPGGWRNGLRLRADVILARQRQLAVPFAAVTRLAGQSFVYVVGSRAQLLARPGRVQREAVNGWPASTLFALQVPVRLGPLQNNRYPVVSGLTAGERVITSALLQLRHGTPVKLR